MNDNYFQKLNRCYIVAEIGVNHNGNVLLAKEMIKQAKIAGADAVKFQTFNAERLVSQGTPKVSYQINHTDPSESHFEMIKRLELSRNDHLILYENCKDLGIDFISTPYDIESAQFLVNLGIKILKTASADIVDLPLHQFIASTKIPTMIATGMSSLGEVEDVVDIYSNAAHKDIVLLHCVSNYPCSAQSLNMRAMSTLGSAFDLPIGYSDHSQGHIASVLAIALNAKVIEKHFTIDRSLSGPDQAASSTPNEFNYLVHSIRDAEKMLGEKRKKAQMEELGMADVSRKSICLSREINAGETIRLSDLTLMRPGTGLQANLITYVLGKKARQSLKAGHFLSLNEIE